METQLHNINTKSFLEDPEKTQDPAGIQTQYLITS